MQTGEPDKHAALRQAQFKPDHFCIVVDDLLAATRAWEALGFIVTQASDTGRGSCNALIVLADGVYIELVQPPRRAWMLRLLAMTRPTGLPARLLAGERAFMQRFLFHWTGAPRGAWVDWCLAASPLDAAVDGAKARGIAIEVPIFTFGRRTAGGDYARWRMVGTLHCGLPFLIEDLPGHASRAPLRLRGHHPNGALGLRRVVVGAPDPDAALRDLAALTGIDAVGATISFGGVDFEIVPAPERSSAGPIELVLWTDDPERRGGLLDPALTGGARLRFEA